MSNIVANNIAVAKRAVSHLNKRAAERQLSDLQPFFDCLADDAVFKVGCSADMPVYGGEFRGKEAIIKLFTGQDQESVEDIEIVGPMEFIGCGERVVILAVQRYKIKKTGATVRDSEFATVYDFRDGLIVRVLSIEDVSEWALASQYNPRGAD